MKTTSIILSILLGPLIAFSQVNSSFDFILGIENSYRYNSILDNSTFTSSSVIQSQAYGARSKREVNKKAWRLGFNYNRPLFEEWTLKLGLRVVNSGFKSNNLNDILWQTEQDGIDGWISEPQLVDTYQKKYNFYFIEIPVGIRYEFEKRKFTPFIEVGMAPTFLISSNTKEITNVDVKKSELEDLNVLHMVGYVSGGFMFKFNEISSMFFQPIFRIHATTLQENNEYEDYLYNIGFELGLRKLIE